jgi:hypothetical protein
VEWQQGDNVMSKYSNEYGFLPLALAGWGLAEWAIAIAAGTGVTILGGVAINNFTKANPYSECVQALINAGVEKNTAANQCTASMGTKEQTLMQQITTPAIIFGCIAIFAPKIITGVQDAMNKVKEKVNA